MAAKIIAFMNQKGGVGKTTSTVNVGAILANDYGRRVLLVDLDPQGNTSDHVGIDPMEVEESVYDVMIDGMNPFDVVKQAHGMDVLPANQDLSGVATELAGADDKAVRLKNALEPMRDSYDYILLDSPPSLDLLTVSGLAAADSVVVAMEAEYLSLRGISQLLQTVEMVKDNLNPGLAVGGVVFCRYDGRTTLAKEVRAEVETHLPGKAFATPIRRNVRLAEAPSRGEPVIFYDPQSAGADDYRELAKEFLERFDDIAPVLGEDVEVELDVQGGKDIMAETHRMLAGEEVETARKNSDLQQ